jgi:hypothetical protein
MRRVGIFAAAVFLPAAALFPASVPAAEELSAAGAASISAAPSASDPQRAEPPVRKDYLWPPGKRGKVILLWEHLDDSNDQEFEDFTAFVSYKQSHFQVWSGEFTDGFQLGGYLRDKRRSTYAGLYRFRDDFDHVLQFDTEQVLAKGWVLPVMLRGIYVIDHDEKVAAAAGTDERVGDQEQLQFGTGFDWYHMDYNFMSLRAISDPRAGGRWSFILSERFHNGEQIYVQPGYIIRTDRSTGWFVQGKIKAFRWSIGDYDRFDYTDVDRTIVAAGVELTY